MVQLRFKVWHQSAASQALVSMGMMQNSLEKWVKGIIQDAKNGYVLVARSAWFFEALFSNFSATSLLYFIIEKYIFSSLIINIEEVSEKWARRKNGDYACLMLFIYYDRQRKNEVSLQSRGSNGAVGRMEDLSSSHCKRLLDNKWGE